jgi:hypothetical protein
LTEQTVPRINNDVLGKALMIKLASIFQRVSMAPRCVDQQLMVTAASSRDAASRQKPRLCCRIKQATEESSALPGPCVRCPGVDGSPLAHTIARSRGSMWCTLAQAYMLFKRVTNLGMILNINNPLKYHYFRKKVYLFCYLLF